MRIPIVMASVAALGFGAASAATRTFTEPVMQERPVMERRLVCPEGSKLYELYPKSTSGTLAFSGGSGTSICCAISYNGSSYISVEDDKGEVWQQGASPKVADHVCVSKPPKKSKDDGEKE